MQPESYRNHYCNMCNWTGDAFLKRDNSLVCPKCFSRQRHRSIFRYLSENALLEGEECLDIASRNIFQKRLNYSEYSTIDIVPGFARYTMDVRKLLFSDNQFDLIICCSVLQFISDYQKALSEIHRVLKKSGIAIFQIPYCKSISQSEIIKQDYPSKSSRSKATHHAVSFSYSDFLGKIRTLFNVKTIIYTDTPLLFSDHEIFICTL